MNPCETPCPKCGGQNVARQFHKKDAVINAKEYDVRPLPGWSAGGGWRFWATRDLIHHQCRTCQFGWVGKPLGKVKAAAETWTDEQRRSLLDVAHYAYHILDDSDDDANDDHTELGKALSRLSPDDTDPHEVIKNLRASLS